MYFGRQAIQEIPDEVKKLLIQAVRVLRNKCKGLLGINKENTKLISEVLQNTTIVQNVLEGKTHKNESVLLESDCTWFNWMYKKYYRE